MERQHEKCTDEEETPEQKRRKLDPSIEAEFAPTSSNMKTNTKGEDTSEQEKTNLDPSAQESASGSSSMNPGTEGEDTTEQRRQKLNTSTESEFTSKNIVDVNVEKKHNPCTNKDDTTPAKKVARFFDRNTQYSASRLKYNMHGIIYQLKLIMLFMKRALAKGYSFRIATEMNAAEKFDDLVFQYRKTENDDIKMRFLQAKHKLDESKKITVKELQKDNDDEFSLQKYFISYRKILNNPELADHLTKESTDFVICTNIDFDKDGLRKETIGLSDVDEPDEFLEMRISRKTPHRYKIQVDEKHILYEILQNTSDLHLLANELALHITAAKGKKKSEGKVRKRAPRATDYEEEEKPKEEAKPEDEKSKEEKPIVHLNLRKIFQSYHQALVQEKVVKINDERQGNRKDAEFHEKFINDDSELTKPAKLLRKLLKDRHLSLNDVKFSLSSPFGKGFELDADPKITNIEQFAAAFATLLESAEDEVVTLKKKKYRKNAKKQTEQVVASNIDKLAGHVLVKKDTDIVFRADFFKEDIKLPGNLEEFREALIRKLGSHSFDELQHYKFNINGFKTCEEEQLHTKPTLPGDYISNDDITGFFRKLVFAVNQPDEVELGDIIRWEICDDPQFNILNNKLAYTYFQGQMLDWFKQKEGIWHSEDDGINYFKDIEKQANILIAVGISKAYPEKLKGYNVKFKSKNEQLTQFLTDESANKSQVLNITTEDTLLSSIKVYDELCRLGTQKVPLYKAHDSYIFISLKTALRLGTQDHIIKAFRGQAPKDKRPTNDNFTDTNLLVIECKSVEKYVDALYSQLSDVIKGNRSKKLILVTGKNDLLASMFDADQDLKKKFKSIKDVNSFTDLAGNSQDMIMKKKVVFQGQERSLGDLIGKKNKSAKAALRTKTLVHLIKDKDIFIGREPFRFSQLQAAYMKPCNEAIRACDLVDGLSASLVESTRFFVTGIEESRTRTREDELLRKLHKNITGDYEEKLKRIKSLVTDDPHMIEIYNEREDNDFKKFCHNIMNPKQLITYWIHWEIDHFVWKQLYDPNFYLKRQFLYRKKVFLTKDVKKELVQEEPDNLFVFKGVAMSELAKMLDVCSKEEKFFRQNVKFDDFDDKEQNIPIHWITVKDSDGVKQLIWEQSHGALDGLYKYIDKAKSEPVIRDEDYFAEKVKDKTAIIIGEPGMGKTTTVTKLSENKIIANFNNAPPNTNWVIRINLKDCQEAIKILPLDGNDFEEKIVKFLLKTKSLGSGCGLEITESLIENKLKNPRGILSHQRLLFLFDGFDEIKDDTEEEKGRLKVSMLLTFLKDKATVWVTARKHEKQLLQNSLSVFDTEFQELDGTQQIKFLKKFWRARLSLAFSRDQLADVFDNKDDSKFTLYSKKLLNSANQVFDGEDMGRFMGIPLQMRLIAEYFQEEFKLYARSYDMVPDIPEFKIFDLYQYFVNERYTIYYTEKAGLSKRPTLSKVSKRWLTEAVAKRHRRLAFREIFHDKAKEFLGTKLPFLERDDESSLELDPMEMEELLRVGIVQYPNCEFIHRTIAEYIVADLFANLLRKRQSNPPKYKKARSFLLKCIFKESSVVVYRFLKTALQNEENLKSEWNSIEECLLLQETNEANKLEYKLQVEMDKSLHDSQQDLHSNMTWVGKKYRFSEDHINLITSYFLIFFRETNAEALKLALEFLLKAHRASHSEKANEALENNIYNAVNYYLIQAGKQGEIKTETVQTALTVLGGERQRILNVDALINPDQHTTGNREQLKQCLATKNYELLYLAARVSNYRYVADIKEHVSDEYRKHDLRQITSSEVNENQTENQVRWLKSKGADRAKFLMLLTPEMSQAFTSVLRNSTLDVDILDYTKNIFHRFIWPVLDVERDLPNIDKPGFLSIFHSFVEVASQRDLTINSGRLHAVLKFVQHVLNDISATNLSHAVQTLIALRRWKLKLVKVNDQLVVLDPSGDFYHELTPNCKDQIVKLIIWKKHNPTGDFESMCESVARDINESVIFC